MLHWILFGCFLCDSRTQNEQKTPEDPDSRREMATEMLQYKLSRRDENQPQIKTQDEGQHQGWKQVD